MVTDVGGDQRALLDDLRRLNTALLAAAAVVVVLVAVGLVTGVEVLTRVRPQWPQIYPYTVAGSGALVVALLLLRRPGRSAAARVGRGLAALTGVLAAGVDLAVAAGLIPSSDPATSDTPRWITALPTVCAVLLCVSVALLGVGGRRLSVARFWIAAAAGLVPVLSLLSYLYGSTVLFHGLGLTGISLPTTVLGLLVTGASLTAAPDRPPLAGLADRYDRGLVTRVLPLAAALVVVPAAVAWLVSLVVQDPATAAASAQLATMVILVALVVVAGLGRSRAQRALLVERDRVWAAFAHSPAATAVVSPGAEVLLANTALARLLDRSADLIVGMSVLDLIDPADRAQVAEGLTGVLGGRLAEVRADVRLLRPGGQQVWVDLGVAAVGGPAGKVVYLIWQCRDLSDRKRLEEVLAAQATRDPLTGLANRERLDQFLAAAVAQETPSRVIAVVFADVDHLKPVNDAFGHAAGDDLLQEVARRLQAAVRSGDLVARVGGDEFVVVTSLPLDAADPAPIVQRLRERLLGPYATRGGVVTISVSLGAAVLGPDGATAALRRADDAMYEDKAQRRSLPQL